MYRFATIDAFAALCAAASSQQTVNKGVVSRHTFSIIKIAARPSLALEAVVPRWPPGVHFAAIIRVRSLAPLSTTVASEALSGNYSPCVQPTWQHTEPALKCIALLLTVQHASVIALSVKY